MSPRSAPKNRQPKLAVFQPPEVSIVNRQRKLPIDLSHIRRLVRHAIPLCLARGGPLPPVLSTLPKIVVSIVSPAAMSRVHINFLNTQGPTDVITFPYGEILVCAAIAAENSALYGNTLDDELALYVIHGLLHLNGFDDLTHTRARQMRARQAKILNTARRSLTYTTT